MLAPIAAALLIGFLLGLLAFKVKLRWCPHCGSTTLPMRPDLEKIGGRRV